MPVRFGSFRGGAADEAAGSRCYAHERLEARCDVRFAVAAGSRCYARFAVAAVALCTAAAQACSVPVFRYALDRWPADAYQLEISAADAKDEAVARFLRNFTDSTPLNLAPVRSRADGAASTDGTNGRDGTDGTYGSERLGKHGASFLGFPHAPSGAAPAWSGSLNGGTLPLLTDSPARAELVRRILGGESGVWFLVESGEREADDRAAATIEKRLRYLEQVAAIPAIDPNDPSSQVGPGPALRVKFSLLRLRRDDPAEQPFLKMLAGPKTQASPAPEARGRASLAKAEAGLADRPWFALVFGRGRVLGAWPAAGFGDEQIDEVCLFLLGACSCEVKRMNPGWDLLLNANWNEALETIGFPVSGAPAAEPPVSDAVKAEPSEANTFVFTPIAPRRKTGTHTAVAALVLLVLGTALAWHTMRRQP